MPYHVKSLGNPAVHHSGHDNHRTTATRQHYSKKRIYHTKRTTNTAPLQLRHSLHTADLGRPVHIRRRLHPSRPASRVLSDRPSYAHRHRLNLAAARTGTGPGCRSLPVANSSPARCPSVVPRRIVDDHLRHRRRRGVEHGRGRGVRR